MPRYDQESSLDYARALAARIELAIAMDDRDRARALHAQLKDMQLSEGDRRALRYELAALDELDIDPG